MDELKKQFEAWMDEAIEKLGALRARLDGDHDGDLDDALVEEVYGLGHNIKGMAGSFDFDLLAEVATSVCLYIKRKPDGVPWDAACLDAHLKSIAVIYTQRITGDGGTDGKQVLERLSNRVSAAHQA